MLQIIINGIPANHQLTVITHITSKIFQMLVITRVSAFIITSPISHFSSF